MAPRSTSTDVPISLARAALDVDAAISAAAAAGLGRGLMLASLLVLTAAAIGWLITTVRTRQSRPRASIPLRAVGLGASAVAALGGAVGLAGSVTSAWILTGMSTPATRTAWLALWSLAVLSLGIGLFVWLRRSPSGRSRGRLFTILSIVVPAVMLVAIAAAPELGRPARSAQAITSLSDTVQVTVVVSPAAAGPNDIRVALTGPDDDVAAVLAGVESGSATATFVSLELGTESQPVDLSVDDSGSLVARDFTASSAGRWRIQLDLGTGEPVLVDVTLQPNPAAS
jgi:hypothetical protein